MARCPAQHRSHAQLELTEAEGFGDVVVRAVLKPLDALVLLAPGGEHDQRQVASHRAQPSAHLEPSDAGQHEVEDHEVDRRTGEALDRRLPVCHGLHEMPAPREVARNGVPHRRVVLDEQDPHHGARLGPPGHAATGSAGIRNTVVTRRAARLSAMRRIVQSKKLQHVRYDVRGPILVEAHRLESEGHKILKLNIGNTAPFGFEAPEAIVADMIHNLPESQGYADSQGIYSARTAVAQYYQSHGLTDTGVDDVYIGNGVSELIGMVLQAFVDDGNEILVPAPDYPLWTGAVTLSGGTPVHYRCDEANGWNPDLEDIEAKITANTHAIVVINPNNPTGAVYSEETVRALVDIARRHRLVVMADEIYEKILFDDAVHHHAATYARRRRAVPDLQRALQGLPGLRLPRRLGHGVRARRTWPRTSSRASPCSPTCGCAPTCPRSTPSRPRSAATSRSPSSSCPAGASTSRASSPPACSTRSPVSRASSRAAPSTASRGSTRRSTASRATRRS